MFGFIRRWFERRQAEATMGHYFTPAVMEEVSKHSGEEIPDSWSGQMDLCIIQVRDDSTPVGDSVSDLAQEHLTDYQQSLDGLIFVCSGTSFRGDPTDLAPFRSALADLATQSEAVRFVYGSGTATIFSRPQTTYTMHGTDVMKERLSSLDYGQSEEVAVP